MKQKLFSLLLAIVAGTSIAFAQSGTCGENLTWELTDGVLTISGTGAMENYVHYYDAPWYSYRSSVNTVTIEDGVTSIGKYAFFKYSGLKSVTIPNSVTSIGGSAFYDCSSLTSITIPNSVTSIGGSAFYGCSNLKSPVYNATIFAYMPTSYYGAYTIPDGIKSIIGGAFYGCSSLTSITIPNSVTSIGYEAFYGCSSLTSVTIPNSVTSINANAFSACWNLMSVIWNAKKCNDFSSSDYAPFYSIRTRIASFIFGDEVEYIPADLCWGLSKLTYIEIPNSVTSIGNYAFKYCSSLTSVTISNSVTSIGTSAFATNEHTEWVNNFGWHIEDHDVKEIHFIGTLEDWCFKSFDPSIISYSYTLYINGKAVTDAVIPNSVTSIGGSAFYGCSSLTSVTIPNSVTSIGGSAFYGCSSLTSVTIPNSVTSIYGSAFYGCSSLKSVTIPNSVTSIGDYAFSGCSSLKSPVYNATIFAYLPASYYDAYTIPDGIKSIAGGAFYGCSSLKSIAIPNSVTSIGYEAFRDCSGLKSIAIPNSVTSIGYEAFRDCSGLKSVLMVSSTPPSVGSEEFPSSTTIYVPLGAFNDYKASDWKNYNLRVFELKAVTSAQSPTSAKVTINASLKEEDKNKFVKSCGVEGSSEEFSGNIAEFIGLEPESEYEDVPFFIRTTAGDYDTIHVSFSTSALTLNTLESKAVSDNTAILLAETNMSDAETSCGFEWRRNDQPEDMASNQVICPVANGLLAGRLKGLKNDIYYKYRAFYKSAAGKMYYGDWQYIFTGDVAVEFDPVLYTYAAQFITEHDVTLKGYALAGSDDFTEQGFEYWAEGRNSNHAPRRAPQYVIGEKHTVTGSGISMQVTLDNLDEGTVYKYRTYAKLGETVIYGSEMQFTTTGEYIEYTVTFKDRDGNTVSTRIVRPGKDAEAPDAPEIKGWRFKEWDTDFTNVQSDIVVTAVYEEVVVYTLTVTSADETMGTVTGGGQYNDGGKATVEALPKTGYRFVRWSDDNTENPRNVTITKDITLTAYFEEIPNALDDTQAETASPRKMMRDGVMYIVMPDGRRYDMQGTEVR